MKGYEYTNRDISIGEATTSELDKRIRDALKVLNGTHDSKTKAITAVNILNTGFPF